MRAPPGLCVKLYLAIVDVMLLRSGPQLKVGPHAAAHSKVTREDVFLFEHDLMTAQLTEANKERMDYSSFLTMDTLSYVILILAGVTACLNSFIVWPSAIIGWTSHVSKSIGISVIVFRLWDLICFSVPQY